MKEVTTLRTFSDILNARPSTKVMFDEVAHLLQIVLTIPVTTATAERTFSVLRHLKTFLRSSMSQPHLNHVTILHIHKERTDQLDMLEMAGILYLLMIGKDYSLANFETCLY